MHEAMDIKHFGQPRKEAVEVCGSGLRVQVTLEHANEMTYVERMNAVFGWASDKDARPAGSNARREHERALDTLRRFVEIAYSNIGVSCAFDTIKGYCHHGDLPTFMLGPVFDPCTRPNHGDGSEMLFLDWCERILRRLGWESVLAFKAAFWEFGSDDVTIQAVKEAMKGKPSSVRFFGLLA